MRPFYDNFDEHKKFFDSFKAIFLVYKEFLQICDLWYTPKKMFLTKIIYLMIKT